MEAFKRTNSVFYNKKKQMGGVNTGNPQMLILKKRVKQEGHARRKSLEEGNNQL